MGGGGVFDIPLWQQIRPSKGPDNVCSLLVSIYK